MMLEIDINEIKSKKYKLFINYAFFNCNYFSFVIDKDNQFHNNLLELLKLNCPQDILNEKIVYVHPETGTNFDGGYMITLKCNAYSRALFLKVYCIEDFNGIDFPEDLCFYKNGTVWFKFISHEKILLVLSEDVRDIDFFKSNKIYYNYTI